MKGNISKGFYRNFKKRIPIIALVIVILVVMVSLTVGLLNRNDNEAGKFNPTLPELQFNGDDGYVENANQPGIELQATTGLVFKSGMTQQEVDFRNPDKNKCVVTIALYLSDGTLLYKSDYLSPSETINVIEISKELKSGLYKGALMVYDCYSLDEPHIAMSRCEFPIEIKCI